MVDWTRFDPDAYELTFNDRKLQVHGISRFDVYEVLWNGFHVIRNKRDRSRYRIRGRTDDGRALEVIAVVESKRRVRFITGWPL